MISATLFGSCLEVQITGSAADVKAGVARLKRAIPDATYDEFKRVWVVQHAGNYLHLPFVIDAVYVAAHQPWLFDPAPEGEIQ